MKKKVNMQILEKLFRYFKKYEKNIKKIRSDSLFKYPRPI